MRSNSNARNAIPSQSCSCNMKYLIIRARKSLWETLRSSGRFYSVLAELWYSYLCPCPQKLYTFPTVPMCFTSVFSKVPLAWAWVRTSQLACAHSSNQPIPGRHFAAGSSGDPISWCTCFLLLFSERDSLTTLSGYRVTPLSGSISCRTCTPGSTRCTACRRRSGAAAPSTVYCSIS